jgi:hypothetical protein
VALFVVLKCWSAIFRYNFLQVRLAHTVRVPTVATMLQLARHGCAVFKFNVCFRQASLWSPLFVVVFFVVVVAVAAVMSVSDDAVVVDVFLLGSRPCVLLMFVVIVGSFAAL